MRATTPEMLERDSLGIEAAIVGPAIALSKAGAFGVSGADGRCTGAQFASPSLRLFALGFFSSRADWKRCSYKNAGITGKTLDNFRGKSQTGQSSANEPEQESITKHEHLCRSEFHDESKRESDGG